MNATFGIVLTLSTLATRGHRQDLSLDQTRTALACGVPGAPACAPSDDSDRHHPRAYGDAGTPDDGTEECRAEGTSGYDVGEWRQERSDLEADAGGRRGDDDRHEGRGRGSPDGAA